jgi:hypothetical protein
MSKTLKQYAEENNISYSTAYRKYVRGGIPNAIKEKGDIIIQDIQPKSLVKITDKVYHTQAADSTRTNNSANSGPDDNYKNINSLFAPYYRNGQGNTSSVNNSCLDPSYMLDLCQKAYYGFSPVRRTVNTLKEFSASQIYLVGGSEKSRSFFTNYFAAIKLSSFIDNFFLEFWRSHNCFIYKLKGKINPTSLNKIKNSFSATASKASVPVKYIILNPVDIVYEGSAFFVDGKYFKAFNKYEVSRLADPQTESERLLAASLPEDFKKQIKNKNGFGTLNVELPKELVSCVFNGKTDYEGFVVPLIYTVLDDIEHKLELKQMDRAIAKTCQQAVLHVKLGYESKDGEYNFPEKAAEKINEIFSGDSVGKVLITDFTGELDFIIPDISELLDPKKYEEVDRDIKEGLMDIIFGSDDKYSNLSTKVKVFIEKIRKARHIFLTEFLIPEMEQIAEEVGLKQIPTPKFEDIDVEDSIEFYRIITRLAEIGVLTPEETFQAFENGRLPTAQESVESQNKLKKNKDEKLYVPLLNNGKDTPEEAGRPGGSKAPKAPAAVGSFDVNKVRPILLEEINLKNEIANKFKKKFKVKSFNNEQLDLVNSLGDLIIKNEEPKNWKSSIDKYYASNEKTELSDKIEAYASELGISVDSAATLYHAKNS